jgi:hypothetical protein
MLDLPPVESPPGPPTPTLTVADRRSVLSAAAANPAFQLQAVAPGFAVYRLRHAPRVWLIEFADLAIQARALNRLAHVLEGRSGVGAPLPDEATVAAWLRDQGADPLRLRIGHDYGLAELRGFFGRAQVEDLALNPAERSLRDQLQALGLLAPAGRDGPGAGADGAIVALTRASTMPSALRLTPAEYRAVLRHELSHAELMTNPAYRTYCIAFWRGLPEAARAALRGQFIRWHYDPTDEVRLASELQAYLWEVELGGFLDLHLRRAATSLAALRTAFLEGLDAQGGAAARFLRLPGMREPLARGPAWGDEAQLAKRVERSIR